MKKLVICIIFITFLAALPSRGVKLEKVRFGYYPEKIRAVLDFDTPFSHTAEESKEKIVIRLPKTEASPDIHNYLELSDLIVRYFEVEKDGDDLKITIPLREPIPYNIFALNDPPRLVIDFNREFTNIVSGGTVSEGVESLKVSMVNPNGRVTANVLKVDLSKAEVSPALARRDKPNLFQSFINLFNPWKEMDQDKRFYRAKVSEIAQEQDAVAAVNGTYFAYTGKPLGTLLIDKELVSSPIYDRTALIITDDRKAFVDNIKIDTYFRTPNGVRYNITGINQGRGKEAVILYSPVWGEQTGTGRDGIELIVSGRAVKEIKLGNSPIPRDGYVISISGPATQFLYDNVKVGDKLDTHIRVIPFATAPKTILHMISGGPRLVKNGVVYVSKHEEKFKADIAKGRAARTAVGVTADGKLLLVAVDGLPRSKEDRSEKSSIGMTLEEMAELLISLRAVEALNLDGGSSTTMWVDGKVISQSVNGSEQKVSNALVVRPRI